MTDWLPEDFWTWVAIVGIASTTVLTRCTLPLLGLKPTLPHRVEQALQFAPICALAAIVAPEVLLVQGEPSFAPSNPRLVAMLAAAAAFLWTRSVLWTIAAGMTVLTAMRLL